MYLPSSNVLVVIIYLFVLSGCTDFRQENAKERLDSIVSKGTSHYIKKRSINDRALVVTGLKAVWKFGKTALTDSTSESVQSLGSEVLEFIPKILDPSEILPTLAAERYLKGHSTFRKVGQKLGEWIGKYVGTSFIGPVGGVLGGIIGRFIGDVIGRVLCLFACGRSSPPPDDTPPQLSCPKSVDVVLDSLVRSARVVFKKAKARDNKNVDVSNTVWLEVILGYIPEEENQDVYYLNSLPEGSYFYRFYAWDTMQNRGYCNFNVSIRDLRCSEPPLIAKGTYEVDTLILGGRLHYWCRRGYRLNGPAIMECKRPSDTRLQAKWSSDPPYCSPSFCTKPTEIVNSNLECGLQYISEACNQQNECMFNTRCKYTCGEGYSIPLGTRATLICQTNGTWDANVPVCIDSKPPQLVPHTCRLEVVAYINPGQSVARIFWTKPRYEDNSDTLTVDQISGPSIGSNVSEGKYIVKYEARDRAGNRGTFCIFGVQVRGVTCSPIMLLNKDVTMNCTNNYERGSTCTFACRNSVEVEGSKSAECIADGNPPVAHWQFDLAQQPSCKGSGCEKPRNGINAELSCDIWYHGRFCQHSCPNNHDTYQANAPNMQHCTWAKGMWSPSQQYDCLPCISATKLQLHLRLMTKFAHCEKNIVVQDVTSICSPVVDILPNVSIALGSSFCNQNMSDVSDGRHLSLSVSLPYTRPPPENYTSELVRVDKLLRTCAELLHANASLHQNWSLVDGGHLQIHCEEGFNAKPDTYCCVGCPYGRYHDGISRQCKLCPVGKYQDSSGYTYCKTCPHGFSTTTTGAKSQIDCKETCQAGSWSSTGLVPCSKCTKGSYQPTSRQRYCELCPTGTSTSFMGATSFDECLEFDMSFSDKTSASTNFVPIDNNLTLATWFKLNVTSTRCTILSYKGQKSFSVVVENGKAAVMTRYGILTTQPLESNRWHNILVMVTAIHIHLMVNNNWYNSSAMYLPSTNAIDELDIFPHQDCSGSLTSLNIWSSVLGENVIQSNTEYCRAVTEGNAVGWSDLLNKPSFLPYLTISQCDSVDNCSPNPCMFGNCTDTKETFICTCDTGYNGTQCDIDIDECLQNDCRNGAKCVDLVGNYACQCLDEFTGSLCEHRMVHGGWGNWTVWSGCSVTCGGGNASRTRQCNDPIPEYDGRGCIGNSSESIECNTIDCPECVTILPPKFGTINCTNSSKSDDMVCTVQCLDGYFHTRQVPENYTCGPSTFFFWTNQITKNIKAFRPPSCSEIEVPESFTIDVSIPYDGLTCGNQNETIKTMDAIRNKVNETVRQAACANRDTCFHTLKVDNCEHQRGKRSINPVVVNIQIERKVSLPNMAYTNVNETHNAFTLLDAITYISDTADGINKTLREAEEVGMSLKNATENGSMALTIDDRTYGVVINETGFKQGTTCPVGTVSKDMMCVACTVGTFYRAGYCEFCREGFYQPLDRQTSCLKCPDGTTTQTKGAIEKSDCIVLCRAGTYKLNDACLLCPKNTYQPSPQQSSCYLCRPGESSPAGSESVANCAKDGLKTCDKGTYYQNSECVDCPIGFYQPYSNTRPTACLRCPGNTSTQQVTSVSIDDCIDGTTNINTELPAFPTADKTRGESDDDDSVTIAIVICVIVMAFILAIIVIYFKRRPNCVDRTKPYQEWDERANSRSQEMVDYSLNHVNNPLYLNSMIAMDLNEDMNRVQNIHDINNDETYQ